MIELVGLETLYPIGELQNPSARLLIVPLLSCSAVAGSVRFRVQTTQRSGNFNGG